jgi:hypothetical protein
MSPLRKVANAKKSVFPNLKACLPAGRLAYRQVGVTDFQQLPPLG